MNFYIYFIRLHFPFFGLSSFTYLPGLPIRQLYGSSYISVIESIGNNAVASHFSGFLAINITI